MLAFFFDVKESPLDIQEHAKKVDQRMLTVLSRHYSQLPFDISVRQYCLDYCRRQVLSGFDLEEVKKTLPSVPFVLEQYNALCFLTMYDEDRIVSCHLGQGRNVIMAIDSAIQQSLRNKSRELKKLKFSLCFLFNEKRIKIHDVGLGHEIVRLGVHALSVKRNNKIAFYKNSVPIRYNFSLYTTLQRLSTKAGLPKNAYLDPASNLRIYDTLEFVEDEEAQLCDLYRGSTLLLQSDVNLTSIKKALKIASDFLADAVLPSGEINHLFYPVKREAKIENTLPALTRNIASLWQLIKIAHAGESSDYLNVAKKAIRRLVSTYFVRTGKFGYLAVSGKTQLGINSLLLLSILATDDDNYLSVEKDSLVTYILSHISRDKKCFTLDDVDELLYPAQALLALLDLFRKTKNKNYLLISELVFPYYQQLFRKTDMKPVMTHWFSKVYTDVFFMTGNMCYANFIFEMNDHLLPYQIPVGFSEVDLTGSFAANGDCRTTASLADSLIVGCRLAKELNDEKRSVTYKKSVLLALRSLLQLQFTSDNCHGSFALGGFKNNIFDHTIRIDNVQHAISTLKNVLDSFFKDYDANVSA